MDAPPKGLRWVQGTPLVAALRPRVSRLYLCLFAAAWNLALGPLHVPEMLAGHPVRKALWFDSGALVAGVLFAVLAVRELALVTRVVFDAKRLVIRAPLAPWVRFDAPLVDIARFEVVPDDDGTHRVVMATPGGAVRKLPLGFETVPLRSNWSRKRLFAAPPSFASFLAARLGEMLDAARRSGHDTYRT